MKKAIKDSKWYWWIPIVYFFYLFEMSHWTFEPNEVEKRNDRGSLILLLMFPSLFAVIGIILSCFKIF